MRATELLESNVPDGIVSILKKKGYKLLGRGADQLAFLEPGSNMILKVFGTSRSGSNTWDLTPAQRTFKAFADYCASHPDNQFLPQFAGWEKFQYEDELYLQIRMERLFEFKGSREWTILLAELASTAELSKSNETKQSFIDEWVGNDDYDYKSRSDHRAAAELFTHLGDDGFNQLWDTIYDLAKIADRENFNVDLHEGNFMLGSDGHIVISDPFFIGWGRG